MVTRSTMKMIKGLGVGMLAGGVLGICSCCYFKRHKKSVKKSMSRALRNMSELVDNVNGMF